MSRLIVFAGAALIVFAAAAGPLRAAGSDNGASFGSSVEDQFRSAVQAVEARDYNKAVDLLTDVLSEQPKNADALNYMGFSQRKLGDYTSAVHYYKQALAVDPDHRGANEYLGEAYLEMHQLAKAETHLARLRQVCGAACEEYRDLAEAVTAYKAKGKLQQDSRR